MSLIKLRGPTLAAALGFGALLVPPTAGAVEKKPAATASKRDLTPKTWEGLFTLVRPQETEWRHLRVQWMTDVVAARRLAAREDRPLVVLYTGGAGYNEPLGVC